MSDDRRREDDDELWEELEDTDDAIIGKAFKVSLAVILAVAGGAAAVVYLLGLGDEGPPPEETAVRAPQAIEAEVTAPSLTFTDVSATAGVDFVHQTGAAGDKLLPETMGSGVVVLDHDGDGAPDLLFLNSCPWTDPSPADSPRLYLNDGAGGFRDVTAQVGLDTPIYAMGAACLDLDGDGVEDLFVSAVGTNRTFVRAGARYVERDLGLGGVGDAWSTCVAPFDMDGDGDLDLFVGNYVRWSPEIDRELDFQLTGIGRAYGPPSNYAGQQPYLYRNDGGGAWTEVGEAAGLHVRTAGTNAPVPKTLGVVPTDYDGDGDVDLVVANDTVPNFLYENDGTGSFEERGGELGLAFDRAGKTTGAMGIDVAWFRGDETLGVGIANFANEMSSLYVLRPEAYAFLDDAVVEGIGAPSRRVLSFGFLFVDLDLDGREDLVQANGHLEPEIEVVQASQTHAQPVQLFWNAGPDARRCFVEVENAGDLTRPAVGRGLTAADLDRDGDLDLVITQNGGPARVLRNEQALGHGWVRLELEAPGANPRALGARVELQTGSGVQRRENVTTRSYLSQVEPALHFGLGRATTIDLVRVRWPDGLVEEFRGLAPNRAHVLRRGES